MKEKLSYSGYTLPLYYICIKEKVFPLPLEEAKRLFRSTPEAELGEKVFDVPYLPRPITVRERMLFEKEAPKIERVDSYSK